MKKYLFLITALSVLVFIGCKKNQLGGKSIIQGKTVHHSRPIPNATVYIKFNAKEFPGTDSTLYDAKTMADASGNFVFKCYKGQYYIYATGVEGSNYLKGGIPVKIRTNETVTKDVPITEVH